jgi:monofunctional biosynthetic peptidoglycan transglycosylase
MKLAWTLIFILFGVVPISAVLLLKWVNPSFTMPMIVRWIRAKIKGDPLKQLRFRWVNIEDVPRCFLKSVVAAEDSIFFHHNGFDWKAIKDVLDQALRTKKIHSGASTISMQCARSTFLWHGRSWVRKILEVYFTILIELFWSKRRILEIYINVIEFGDGVYGIWAGAQWHYNIAVYELREDASIRLAWILPSPKKRAPRALREGDYKYNSIKSVAKRTRIPWRH